MKRIHRSGKTGLKKRDTLREINSLKTDAIIFVSSKHGVQVWYEHEGECGSCERYRECIELLWDFAEEMHLKLLSTEDPTKIADELFRKLKQMVA